MKIIRNTRIMIDLLMQTWAETMDEWRDRCAALAELMDPGTYDTDDYDRARVIIERADREPVHPAQAAPGPAPHAGPAAGPSGTVRSSVA